MLKSFEMETIGFRAKKYNLTFHLIQKSIPKTFFFLKITWWLNTKPLVFLSPEIFTSYDCCIREDCKWCPLSLQATAIHDIFAVIFFNSFVTFQWMYCNYCHRYHNCTENEAKCNFDGNYFSEGGKNLMNLAFYPLR